MPQFLQTLSNFRCGTVRNVHGCSWIERYFAFQIASRMSSGEAWRNHSVLIAFASPSCLFYTMCQWIMTLDRNVTRWPTVTESVHCRCSWTRFRISRANLAFLVARYDSSNCHLKINAFFAFSCISESYAAQSLPVCSTLAARFLIKNTPKSVFEKRLWDFWEQFM